MTATRRRGAALEEAILEAGWEQLVSEGYSGLTFEAVSAKARTSKAVLYRRWPDKEALLLAIIGQHHFRETDDPDTGSLREDVIELLRTRNRLGDHIAAVLSTILGAYFEDTRTTMAELREQLLQERVPVLDRIVRRAIERGEIPDPRLPERIARLPFDLFRNELVMTLDRVPDETIVDIVDTVFMPLATGRAPDSA